MGTDADNQGCEASKDGPWCNKSVMTWRYDGSVNIQCTGHTIQKLCFKNIDKKAYPGSPGKSSTLGAPWSSPKVLCSAADSVQLVLLYCYACKPAYRCVHIWQGAIFSTVIYSMNIFHCDFQYCSKTDIQKILLTSYWNWQDCSPKLVMAVLAMLVVKIILCICNNQSSCWLEDSAGTSCYSR